MEPRASASGPRRPPASDRIVFRFPLLQGTRQRLPLRRHRTVDPAPSRAAALTTTENRDLEPISRRDDLFLPFREACKPPPAWRIGPEVEKAGIFDATRMPIP